MTKKTKILLLLSVILIILLSGCASSYEVQLPDDKSGFWSGLWHGFIAVWSWILSLLFDDVAVYDINNTGGWYDFGFLLGIGAFAGSSSASNNKRKKKNTSNFP